MVCNIKSKILCSRAAWAILGYVAIFVPSNSNMVGKLFVNVNPDIAKNTIKLHFFLIEGTPYYKENQGWGDHPP